MGRPWEDLGGPETLKHHSGKDPAWEPCRDSGAAVHSNVCVRSFVPKSFTIS